MTIAVVDSGGANLGSVVQALNRLGVESVLTREAEVIRTADRVILPGVGQAARAMSSLQAAGLVEILRALRQPVLGICLGLQLLYERSEEGSAPCLGLIPGQVRRLRPGPKLRLPHMGWNRITWQVPDPLASRLGDQDWFYFVHSYAAPAAGALAICEHGDRFAAVVRHNNFAACQFHPEKSAASGQQLLRNFLSS